MNNIVVSSATNSIATNSAGKIIIRGIAEPPQETSLFISASVPGSSRLYKLTNNTLNLLIDDTESAYLLDYTAYANNVLLFASSMGKCMQLDGLTIDYSAFGSDAYLYLPPLASPNKNYATIYDSNIWKHRIWDGTNIVNIDDPTPSIGGAYISNNGNLYGWLNAIDSDPLYLLSYNGADWSRMTQSGSPDGTPRGVRGCYFDPTSNNEFYLTLNNAQTETNEVYKFNGSSWSQIAYNGDPFFDGLSGYLGTVTSGGRLVITSYDNNTMEYSVIAYNGTSWDTLLVTSTAEPSSIVSVGATIYLGYSGALSINESNIYGMAMYQNGNWSAVPGVNFGSDASVRCITSDS